MEEELIRTNWKEIDSVVFPETEEISLGEMILEEYFDEYARYVADKRNKCKNKHGLLLNDRIYAEVENIYYKLRPLFPFRNTLEITSESIWFTIIKDEYEIHYEYSLENQEEQEEEFGVFFAIYYIKEIVQIYQYYTEDNLIENSINKIKELLDKDIEQRKCNN